MDDAFNSAPLEDKIGYLSSVDKDFANAHPQDQIQYLMHIGAIPAMPGPPQPNMETSAVPTLAKGAIDAAPVVGGLAGGIVGSGLSPAGTVAGAGLGAAGGESLRQLLMNKMFGEGPTPTSKQGLTQTAIAGLVGAASEVPGAILQGLGNRAISEMSTLVPAEQSGDAVAGMEANMPAAMSGKGMGQDLEMSRRALVDKLSDLASNAPGTSKVDSLVANARNQAVQADLKLPGTLKKFDKIIAAAKINSGITGDASAQQLLAFQKQLQKPGFVGKPGPVAEVLSDLMKNAYGSVGQGVEQLAPGSADLLSKMSDIYAAQAGLKTVTPGSLQSMAMSAALHPRTMAIASPVLTGATVAGGRAVLDKLRNTSSLATSF